MNTASWTILPAELKLTIAAAVTDRADAWSLAQTDKCTYGVCLESLFQHVVLKDYLSLQKFLQNVPREYGGYILRLCLCTQFTKDQATVADITSAVITILDSTTRLEQLELRTSGSLDKSVIPAFGSLASLRELYMGNCAEEERMPLSERLVVSIAATVPHLTSLTVDRVTRSTMHAPELLCAVFPVPLVSSDHDIPDHPLLGEDLSLPSLLRIPTLEALAIRDTHLGDPRWATIEASCTLQKLELGSCMHVPPEDDAAALVLAAAGDTVSELTISSPSMTVCPSTCGREDMRLRKLRRLSVSEHFPPADVVDTLETLRESPIERLDFACFSDDIPDVCDALQEFFETRRLTGGLHTKLRTVEVMLQDADPDMRLRRKLADICHGVNVFVRGVSSVFAPDVRVRGRAMTV